MPVTINGSTGVVSPNGSAGTPAYQGADANTGVFYPAADTVAIATNGTEAMRIDSSRNVGIGTTSPGVRLSIAGPSTAYQLALATNSSTNGFVLGSPSADTLTFASWAGTERARIDSSGNLLVAKTASSFGTAGLEYDASVKQLNLTTSGNSSLRINRLASDGILVSFQQDSAEEGTISVSGTTVSYNGGHLSRYAQTLGPKDDTLVKGTVLSNLDEMNVYTDVDGSPVANEQLNKVKVSDVEGDPNVAGVFVNWSYDEAHEVDEINMAMTGDMIIRIAQGVTVQRGDLLMSAGDGTAKPQGDDIIRSKTVAKVTSTHVTCTYADGSYCVPCVLMAC